MIINDEAKNVVTGTAFITLVTINADGTPHPIIAGKGEVDGDTVVFGIYKMEKTQKNILANNHASIVACTVTDAGPKGYRLTGTALAKEKQLIFSALNAEELL